MSGPKKTVVGETTKIKTKNPADHPGVFLVITKSCEFWTSRVARAEEIVVGKKTKIKKRKIKKITLMYF